MPSPDSVRVQPLTRPGSLGACERQMIIVAAISPELFTYPYGDLRAHLAYGIRHASGDEQLCSSSTTHATPHIDVFNLPTATSQMRARDWP